MHIKEVYGYVETKDGGKYMLSGDVFETIQPGFYDSDEHDDDEVFYVEGFLRFVDPQIITGISQDEDDSNWFIKFTNGDELTLNSVNMVKNFLTTYQQLR